MEMNFLVSLFPFKEAILWLPMLFEGLLMTLKVGLLAFMLALVIGLLGAAGKDSSIALLRYFWRSYSLLIRGLPEVLVVFLVFYGGTSLMRYLGHVYPHFFLKDVSAFVASIIALGCLSGAYAIEVFRGAFRAIPVGQIEAAKALGMSRALIFRHIIFPQLLKHALPGLSNQWLVMLKDTALVSMIGLDDLMRKGQIAAGATFEPFIFYSLIAFFYLILTFISNGFVRAAELYAHRGEVKMGSHWI